MATTAARGEVEGRAGLETLRARRGDLIQKQQRVGSSLLVVLAGAVCIALVAVVLRLAYDVVTGPSPKGDALQAIWAFLAAVVAAGVTLTGIYFTRRQTERTEERLALDTATNGLKLLMAEDGIHYAPRGVVAGAIATLVHLKHPVIAMRALAPCWESEAVDIPSATWLISEIFASQASQAQLEAAVMLDAHAHELCRKAPGSYSWPASIEFCWISNTLLPTRLLVLRAVLRTLVSKDPRWWRDGGRQGWAVVLLHNAMQMDADDELKAHAKAALDKLVPLMVRSKLTDLQSADGWLSIAKVKVNMKAAPKKKREIVMLRGSLCELKYWASRTEPTPDTVV
jgi:hypothetical protein